MELRNLASGLWQLALAHRPENCEEAPISFEQANYNIQAFEAGTTGTSSSITISS